MTRKTVLSAATVKVKCPKCDIESDLANWRQSSIRSTDQEVVEFELQKTRRRSPWADFLSIFLYFLAIFFGLGAVVFFFAPFLAEVNRTGYDSLPQLEKDIGYIATTLGFFKMALVTWILLKLANSIGIGEAK